jgi:hypothetical protein
MCPRAKTSWIKAFRLHIRDAAFFEAFNLAGEPSEVLLKADDRLAQLLAEIEARGVLAPEGDQVAAKTHVVADKDFEACANLQGHGFVIPGAQAQCRDAISGFPVGKSKHTEEDGAIASQREVFLADVAAVLAEHAVGGELQ